MTDVGRCWKGLNPLKELSDSSSSVDELPLILLSLFRTVLLQEQVIVAAKGATSRSPGASLNAERCSTERKVHRQDAPIDSRATTFILVEAFLHRCLLVCEKALPVPSTTISYTRQAVCTCLAKFQTWCEYPILTTGLTLPVRTYGTSTVPYRTLYRYGTSSGHARRRDFCCVGP